MRTKRSPIRLHRPRRPQRARWFAAWVAGGIVLCGAQAPSLAARGPADVDTRLLGTSGWAAADPTARRDVIVVLDGDGAYHRLRASERTATAMALGPFGGASAAYSVAQVGAATTTTAAAAREHARRMDAAYAAVDDAQAGVLASLAARGVPIISRYETLQNGFLVAARRDDIDAMAGWPGVTSLMPAPEMRLALANAVPHIGADQVAASLGYDGRNVTIGVIDTGIDYFHAAFGGPGTSGAYGADDHAKVERGTFPTAKVIGGYDFAGSTYAGSGPAAPDDDPVDENGHGTHVAGIAAGNAWSGFHGGVAPGARLVALKVFGANGSTNLAYDAIEWAVEAKIGHAVPGTAADIDVLNLSLGSAWASSSAFENAVIDQAVDAGIVVVGAAGNDGDIAFVTGGPGDATSAIAAASTVGPGQLGDRVQSIVDGVVTDIEAIESHPSLGARMAGIGTLQAPAVWYGRACAGDVAEGNAAGRVAVLVRGDCAFRDKIARAMADGAVAAVVVDNGGGLVPMGTDGGALGIPAYMIAAADGARLHSALRLGATVEVRLDGSFNGRFPRRSLIDTVSSFSSRGITRDGRFKPDIAAPGSGIVAPAIGSGNRAATLSGTSMASPMVAGAAAVLIDALSRTGHPLVGGDVRSGVAVGPEDVRAILMSTAFTDVKRADARETGSAPFARRGAGRVSLPPAVRASAVLRPSSGTALTFGVRAADRNWSGDALFTLRNLAGTSRRFALSVEWSGDGEATTGLRFAAADPVLEVGPNDTARSRLLAEIIPSELDAYDLRGGASAMNGDHRLEAADRDAYLVARELDGNGLPRADGDVLRAPIWTFLRGASDLAAPDVVTVPQNASRVDIPLTNSGAQAGPAEWFAYLGADPLDAGTARAFDVVLAGARVVGAGAARRIDLALVLDSPTLAPYDVTVEASIDRNGDGAIDDVLTIDDRSAADGAGAAMTGSLQTIRTDARGASPTVVGDADVDVNRRLIVLQADAAALGFGAGQPIAFDVAFEVTARFGGARVDSVPDGALRGGRIVQKLSFSTDGLGYALDAPTRDVAAGETTASSVTFSAPLGADGVRLLALYPLDAPGKGDAQVVTLERGPAAPPTAPPGSTPSPVSPTPSPTPEATPSAPSGPTATEVPPTETATDEPTLPPHVPTVVLPVEPTATDTPDATIEATPSVAPTPTADRPPGTSTAPPSAAPTGPAPGSTATSGSSASPSPSSAAPPTSAVSPPLATVASGRTARIYLPFAYTYVRRRPR
ncbi:MAG: S8 family serine peptidase [Ardenticatenales bacterium]